VATGGQGGAGAPSGTTPGTVTHQGDIAFTATGGWLEYGFAQWTALSGADGYNVYDKLASADDSAYVRADAALVRGTRVDIPGLQGKQSYDLKVVPVTGGSEQTARASVARVTTLAHDRSGFAFHSASPNGNASGAYNADGTLKPDALVLYVSEATKDTVTMAVTKGTKSTTYAGVGAIMAARQSAGTTVPLAIRVLGVVTAPAGVDSLSLLNLKTNANITMEGIGTDAQCNGWGLNIRAASNVEIRNLSFAMYQDDAVSIQVDNKNVWIHNIDFMVGANGGGDKELGDGSCDIKSNSSYITVAYNHFQGTGKSSLTGQGDSAEFFVSFHHNFFDGSHSRHPRVRWGTVHVYNNYYKGNTTYGAAAAEHANLFVQNNVFENVVRPMLIASQGHDFKDLVPTGQTPGAHESILSGEPGGALKQQGNVLDAVSASWFDAAVDSGDGSSGAYNNFDASFGSAYPIALDSAADGKAKALSLAGRLR
jgi:pectate lyase